MACNNICVLFICLSVLAVFIDYNEALPAPDANDDLAAASPQIEFIGEQFKALTTAELLRFFDGLPNADVAYVFKNTDIPKATLKHALQTIQKNHPNDIAIDGPAIEKLTDDQVVDTIANLSSAGKADLARILSSTQNGNLLVRLPPADIKNLIDILNSAATNPDIVAPKHAHHKADVDAPKPAPVAPKPAPGKAGQGGLGDLLDNLLGDNGIVGGLLGGLLHH